MLVGIICKWGDKKSNTTMRVEQEAETRVVGRTSCGDLKWGVQLRQPRAYIRVGYVSRATAQRLAPPYPSPTRCLRHQDLFGLGSTRISPSKHRHDRTLTAVWLQRTPTRASKARNLWTLLNLVRPSSSGFRMSSAPSESRVRWPRSEKDTNPGKARRSRN